MMRMLWFFQFVIAGVWLSPAAHATIFLSEEARNNSPIGRAAASNLDLGWRTIVAAEKPTAFFEEPDTLADERLKTTPPVQGNLEFPSAGLNVKYSIRRMDNPTSKRQYGSLASGASAGYTVIFGDDGYAPTPAKLVGTGLDGANYTELFTGVNDTSHRSAVLFQFSTPVSAFGMFLKDVESRPTGTLAELHLYDANDAPLNSLEESQLTPTGKLVGDDPGTYIVNSDAGPNNNSLKQWGNGTTQFVGFYDAGAVSKMMLIVGDDDLHGQALSEQIEFVGATAVGVVPSLAGDFNNDGTVDVADYALWRQLFGSSVALPGASADGNGNGVVDAADYVVWRSHINGPAVGLENLAVPEPPGLVLAYGLLFVGCAKKRGYCRRQSR